MKIELTSFGYKYGLPEADNIFDMRCLDNPYWISELREKCGLDSEVREFVFAEEESRQYAQLLLASIVLQAQLSEKITLVHQTGRETLKVGIGCTGGQHRSVAMTEFLAENLKECGYEVNVVHRDLKQRDC